MSSSFSRREMMKLSAGALITLGVWPGRLRAADAATKPLTFVVVNDLHYSEDACAAFFEGLVKKINAIPDVAFVLINGDMLDNGLLSSAHTMHDVLKMLKMPFYCTPGNHDALTQTDRTPYESVFGNNFNYVHETGGWQFVSLDTSDGLKVEKFDCRKETLDFAAGLPGKLDKSKPTFVYTHFPLGPEVKYRVQNADAVLEPFKQLNVAAIFNGHYHGYTQKSVLAEVMVTTHKCCSRKRANHDGTPEKGFFVVEAAEGKYKKTFVDYGADYPGSAKATPVAATRPAATRAR